ncbi:MAG: hypothetical protein EKK69_14880, partial [Candidatus Competibacteraceae bacterium]
MDAAKSVTATFVEPQTLTVAKEGNGSGTITSSPTGINCVNGVDDPPNGSVCESVFPIYSTVTLIATPKGNSDFAGWYGECGGDNPTDGEDLAVCTVTMEKAKLVRARFNLPQELAVAVDAAPGSTGQVTSAPAGIKCSDNSYGTGCTKVFSPSTSVTLTAVPEGANSIFVGWGQDCTGTSPTCTVVIPPTSAATDNSVSATAYFAPTNSLIVNKAGTGSGTVTSSPAGIDCGVDCVETYAANTLVTLTATAQTGSTFTGWSDTDGRCTDVAPTCQVSVSSIKTVTATFTLDTYPLTITMAGTGTGTVARDPVGTACTAPETCTAKYNHGTLVTLTATAGSGIFTGWSGSGCSGTDPCTVTMDAAKSVTATFLPDRTLTVTKVGNGSGTVTSSPIGIECGSDCSEIYALNSVVTLSPSAQPGSTFVGWDGACSGTATCTVTMDTAKSVQARFNLANELTVKVIASGASGTVSSVPPGINCTASSGDCAEVYAANTTVTLSVTPGANAIFAGWAEACASAGTALSCTVTIDGAKSVTAYFAPANSLTVNKVGTGSGTVSSS